ncbi:mucin-binding protein [Limosilactobacillus reuteri]|nr:MucBP domain-containing protein [Limosilactobacillus reuteri]RMX27028.1 YSIRK signal domain/LPXTG anchor domain surface protein [Limosilactobacillus reuteri]
MLSHNNWEEQIKKYEPKKQRFTIKKLSVGVASVLLGVTFAAGTASADSTTANADSASGSDSAEQTDHNLTLNSASTSTLKSATAENQSNNASAAVQNPAGDIKAQAANDYEAAVNAAVANASSDVASEAVQNSASAAQNSAAQNSSATSSNAQASTASAVATQSFTVSSSAVNNNLNYASVFASLAAMPQANTAAQSSAANSTANDEYSGYKTVTNTFELQNAVNDFSINGVNVKGNINLFGDLNINRAFTIHGVDGAVLNLGQNKINNNGQLTLADVTVNGSIMGNGTVNIKGNVTSNVNSINSSVPTQDQYNAQNYTGGKNNFKNSNIAASRVNIENGASLTINSSEINDGINLTDGGTVRVGDNATLNVNLTNVSTTATRYHVAGVFAKNGGNFISGYKSNVNFNTGLGQAISIGATRPTATNSDRFGGYGARSRNDGPTLVQLGESSTFNFTGRDGIILGNNANFISGENSNVHFENKGRGVALDLANNSNIEISKHSTTYFHSVGKTGTSGSYDGYNYIGVNEGGNITVDEYATFRVILEGRGDNPWDDVVSLDSRDANTNAAFTSKTGAIVDIRDDNTNFYAELISFPLGGSNSRIDIQDPLMLNLQRYSNGGATTGWMATGGDMINTTSSQYTSNLIYMSGSKGVFSVSGGDYDPSNPNSSGFVVYQHIKSDGSKQIWLNVNDVNIPMNGFQTKDIWNNQANPDVSINGNGLTGGIRANQVHNDPGSPLTGKDAPYYGISTQRASQQIWIPHRTPLEVTGNHTNTIKYVDEQGNEIFPESTSSLNLKRNIVLDITQDQIKKIQDYALNHTADETLNYIKNAQAVSSDSGWKYTDANGNTVTDPYATVKSPELNGYTATIQSTNVQGLKAGADGSSVTAKFTINPSEDIVQNGELSDSYKNNGVTGIPDNYVTVVVYKKAIEKGSVKVIYHDDTTNTDIPNTEYNTGSVDAGTKVDYTTSTTISNLEKQGYVYVTTDGTIPAEVTGNQNVTVTVHMKHGVQPVTPDTPTPDVPKNTPADAQPDQLTKKVNLAVNYVNADGTQFTGTIPANAKQTATFTGTAYVDKITGKLVNAKQEDGKWVIDIDNTATPQITWTSDKTSFDGVTSPAENGYHVISVSSHKDGNNVAAITGLTKDSSDITVTVTYAKNGEEVVNKQNLPASQTVKYVDDQGNELRPEKKQTSEFVYSGDTKDSVTGQITKQGSWNETNHNFTAEDVPVIDGYVAVSGYTNENGKYVAGGFNASNTGSDADRNKVFTVVYKKVGKIVPVGPDGKTPIPDAPTPSYPNDPTDPTKVTPDEPVPTIPGYTPEVPTVTPVVPTEDTPVVYNPDAQDQTVTVKYIDDTTGEGHTDLSSYDKSIAAKPGEALNYTTQGSIAELENKGYKLVSDNFNVTTMPEKGGNYEVHFIHNTTTITPDKPGNPGEPINPNDPDPNGPKWPNGTDAKSLTKQGTQTVHYVYADGTKAADDNVQNTTFAHTLVFDNVTGKQIEDKGWTPESHKFNDVTSPEINGYHADKTVVNGATVTVDNPSSETTVTYTKNGQETRDQQTVKASQTVKYVDEQGNELRPTKTQNFTYNYTGDTYDKETGKLISRGTWNQDSNDFTAENVPVIDGYVAVKGFTRDDNDKVVAGGFTTTYDATDAKRNRTFTVVYKKVGKIVPVGPDGKTPIPDAPTPSYPNDPTDPTKVTPDEPVPTIPGYTPSQNTVTPPDPTKDTPVVYTKNEAGLKVEYIDQDANNAVLKTDNVDGKIGDKITYTTTSSIDDFTSKGYELVNDGFTGKTGDDFTDANNGKTYQVILKHGTRPVTPDQPGAGYDKTDLQKDITRTIHFINSETGKQVADPVEQTVHFEATGTVDKVTGKLVTVENGKITGEGKLTWTPAQDVKAVTSPAINAMHITYVTRDADGTNVKGVSLTHNDSSYDVYVNYAPNGTKTENGKDIPASQTIKFVDEDGNTLRENNVQTSQFTRTPDVVDTTTGKTITEGSWNETSHKFGTINVPVIDGYVATVKTAGGLTATTDNPNVVTEVVYKKVGKIVPVDPSGKPIPDAPTPSYPNDPTDPTKVTPDEPVPEIPGYTPEVPTVTPDKPTEDTPVIYHPVDNTQYAQVIYRDVQDGANIQLATSGDLKGEAGSEITYSTADTIKQLTDKGYVLKNDGFPAGAVFDNDTKKNQTFYVDFVHGQSPVNPDHPHDGVDPSQYSKDVKETVHYVGAGESTPADNVQNSKWTRSLTVDTVTGKLVENGQYDTDWAIAKGEKSVYDQVNTPVVEGYHADRANVASTAVTQDDINVTVTYTPNGKIIPVDPSGKPIPNVPTPQYPTDPTDPTKVTPNEPVPEIPGYTPSVPTVTPTDPGKDTPVPYTPVTPAKDQQALVNYVDADENNKVITTSGDLNGKAGDKINYSTATTIQDLENKGYVLVNDGFPAGATYDNDDGTVQTYTVVLRHGTQPVTPTNPGKPGEPINPNDPDGPKYPQGSDQVTKNVTRTIQYVDENGNKVSDSVEQPVNFTAQGVLDKVTGEWTTPLTWSIGQTVSAVKSPVVAGYHLVNVDRDAAGNDVAGVTLTHNDNSYTVTVKYAKNGKIIPVDPSGKPIPDVPQPQYPTDPTDPTKVTPDEPVPEIPGYTPETPTVTPDKPGEDTPVVYHPVDNTQNAQVRYIDLTNNEELANSGNLSGQPGDKINYSTADEIKSLEDKGYVLVNDGFPTDAAFDNDKDHDQIFTVTFRHGTRPVTPTNPGKPGEPINPNDPDGPKYPQGSDQVTKNVTRTVQYVDENGNKVSEPVEQTVNFTAEGVLDKVTGEWTTPLTWSGSQAVAGVKTPVVEGYHVVSVDRDGDGFNIKGVTLTHENDDYTVTVKYAKNGKIVPVDPSGKPIPNVPTPQYPTDPTDPAKVTPEEPVPNVPGYTPSVPTVTPTDPGKDTPVPYNPIVNDQTAVVNYVDQDNNNAQIATSGNLTGKPGSVINYSTADQIKQLEDQGYVLVSDGFPAGAVFDNDDNTTQTYTVVLKHGQQPVTPTNPGKPGEPINPNDPDGPKYPDGSDQVTKDVTRTIQYVDENGNKVSEPVEQTAHFTGEGVLDKVTGQWITPIIWTGNGNLTGEKTPVVEGYHVVRVSRDSTDNINVDGTTVNHETNDYTVTVSYAKNGKIVPVDPSGKPIPNVPTPQYPTDPTDPSKVTPDEPVPTIPGYTPSVPTVTPTDPGKDTPVPYNPIVNDQTAVVNYVDQDNNNAQIATSGNLTGKPGSVINYSTADQIKQLEDQGYVLVSDGFPAGAVFDNDDNTTQTYTVVLKHGTTTFKPDKPGTPGEPINPNYPDGPKVTNEDVDYLKDVKFTVHYVGAGNDNPADNVQNAQWTRSITVDNVTGKIISSTEWVSNKGSYDGVKTPVVNGYHADRAQVDGPSVTMEDQEATVTYVPNGKIIPVDPNGTPIPDAPTPQYPTDPTDPTKVTPDEPVPTIPGYKPEVPTVTPTDPGVDTPVKYTPDTVNPKPAVDQIAIVNYVDQDNNNAQIATSGNLTGKAGSVINYSTADQIKELEAQGYVLVTDGFPAGATFDDNADQNQVFTVVLKHGHAPVGPNNPHEPGTPVNPDEPNGPKWPAKDTYTKEYTSTVHFVDNNGNKMRDDDVQTSTWTRTLIIDKVTGQIINPDESWTADKGSYNKVKVPVINGYVADKANVPAKETVQRNIEDTVTYTKVGNIVPVDPSGNPIPNVPAVPYTNDPTDPTKVVPNEPVPSVPGMTPNATTVTPTRPTVDTPVVYTTPTPVTPETPVTPQPDEPATPETPAAPKAETPVPAKTESAAPAKQEAKKLPQTGNENNSAAALGLAALGLTGLLAAGKKRRKED